MRRQFLINKIQKSETQKVSVEKGKFQERFWGSFEVLRGFQKDFGSFQSVKMSQKGFSSVLVGLRKFPIF